jgi:hypothetical protein
MEMVKENSNSGFTNVFRGISGVNSTEHQGVKIFLF